MGKRVLRFTKGQENYIFSYVPGCEDEVMDEIIRLAEDGQSNLNWLDAATLGFQVASYAAEDCCDALNLVDQPQD